MRVLFVLALALLILPLSGCAKKKKDESPATTSGTNGSADMAANPNPGGSAPGGHGMSPPPMGDPATDDPMAAADDGMVDATMDDPMSPANSDESVADSSASQNRNYFNQPGGNSAPGGHGSGQPNSPPNGHGSGSPTSSPPGSPSGHGQGGRNSSQPSGSPMSYPPGSPSGHGQGGRNSSQPSGSPMSYPPGSPNGHGQSAPNSQPNTPPADGSGKGLPGFAQKVVGFFGGNGATSKPAENPGEEMAPDDGMGDTPMPGDLTGEGGPMGESGEPNRAPQKASDVPGIKVGTPEYAAVSLILKVSRGEKEGYDNLIAEDAKGLLADLKAEDNEKALAKAKELMGRVRKRNSRLEDRDTVIYFENDKAKVLQFYVRKIQGDYVVREVRELEATNRSPARRRN